MSGEEKQSGAILVLSAEDLRGRWEDLKTKLVEAFGEHKAADVERGMRLHYRGSAERAAEHARDASALARMHEAGSRVVRSFETAVSAATKRNETIARLAQELADVYGEAKQLRASLYSERGARKAANKRARAAEDASRKIIDQHAKLYEKHFQVAGALRQLVRRPYDPIAIREAEAALVGTAFEAPICEASDKPGQRPVDPHEAPFG